MSGGVRLEPGHGLQGLLFVPSGDLGPGGQLQGGLLGRAEHQPRALRDEQQDAHHLLRSGQTPRDAGRGTRDAGRGRGRKGSIAGQLRPGLPAQAELG